MAVVVSPHPPWPPTDVDIPEVVAQEEPFQISVLAVYQVGVSPPIANAALVDPHPAPLHIDANKDVVEAQLVPFHFSLALVRFHPGTIPPKQRASLVVPMLTE